MLHLKGMAGLLHKFDASGAARRPPPGAAEGEALFLYLVGTIHSARAPLAASMMMAVLITIAAFEITGAYIFLAHLLAHVAIGLARFERLAVYEASSRAGLSLRDAESCDDAFAFWSMLYALTIGLSCYELTAHTASAEPSALALAACTGFTLAFVSRSSGRPRTLRLQIVAVCGPEIYALLTLPLTHGAVYAAMVFGFLGSALVIGRHTHSRIVALFRADEANRQMARRDMLTGLMNRYAISQTFDEMAAGAAKALVVYLLDLDRFKEINDTLGHAVGDAVIVEVANRIAAEGEAEVARMGGDEFMLIRRADRADPAEIEAFARSLLERLSQPFEFDGRAIPLGGSIGAAVYPNHGREMAELMRYADCALYEAKRSGRGRFRLFDESLRSQLAEVRMLEVELEQAIREDQFEVWYQPIHSLHNGALRGYEALVRWRHPTRGLVMPSRFVPIAEQNGAIFRLGQIVLEKACAEAVGWDRRITIAVNLSPQQFRRPELLVEAVRRALDKSGLEPSRLFLEITESFLMEDTPQTRKAINDLADFGVKFSLDDFGAGYSSLAYIQHYPFSKIKIDRSFVENIHTDNVSNAIIASVCVLAERIRVEVVAEGIETVGQQRALADLGVDLGQGYLLGRPARVVTPPPQLQLVASR
ncbi:MAG: EAL domain-containing protein [Pseudomonadota bacterium]|nr:EAL domain-containing protein [Pseudomonadota bacterium]